MRENKLLSTALYRLTAVLLLTVLLITGCTPRNAADSTLSSAQDYEVSVSYTHLDVYKRQAVGYPFFCRKYATIPESIIISTPYIE